LFFATLTRIVVKTLVYRFPGDSMNSAVTRLDQMLYAWLAEPDDRKFDLAFQRYYVEASPALIRYLLRRSSLADLDCEQIAVDALLKFFGRVGRDRRRAAESVANTLPQIQPLDFGPFHVRQARRWTTEVGSFRQASMSFTITPQDDSTRPWKAEMQALTDDIPPLRRQGCHLLESVRIAVDAVTAIGSPEGLCGDAGEETTLQDQEIIRGFALGLRAAAEAGAAAASAAETRHPGVVRFVDGAWTVVDALPLLRVPTNGYLFDIAQSLYLDECKARGRKKRGGAGASAAEPDSDRANAAAPVAAAFALDYADSVDEDGESGPSMTLTAVGYGSESIAAADPASEQIDEDFCEQFYAYLQKPLQDAEEAYRHAAASGKGTAERKRLESLSKKQERLMSVLSMRIEGQTQEAIAETLGISRNQVKYIVELVQSAYAQFCAAAARTAH
jgi:DNA-directed RNA polymerase specialized sigma24 family protein